MKQYQTPDISVCLINACDVLTVSAGGQGSSLVFDLDNIPSQEQYY